MKYLLVDDDINIYNLIKVYLNDQEELFYSGKVQNVIQIVKDQNIDLVLLDIQIENQNGLTFFSQNKDFFSQNNVLVFFLSQVLDLKAKLEAFQFGASDYITKPFEPLELIARIRSKSSQIARTKVFLKKEDLFFDLRSQTVSLCKGDNKELIELSTTEFKLLYYLAKGEGQVFSRQMILDAIWENNPEIIDRTVDQYISKLRKKVKSDYYTIKTNFNLGYSFSSLKKSS